MFCLDMRVQGWIGEIAQFAASASKLTSFLVIPSLPRFLFLRLGCLRIFRIIFYIEVVVHIHRLHIFQIEHSRLTLVVLLSNRKKLSIVLSLYKIGILFR